MDAAGTESYAHFEITPPEEFGFFPRFYITAYFTFVLFTGLLVVVWAPIVYFYLFADIRYGPAMRLSTYLTATFLLLVVFGRVINREMRKVRFIVSREGIKRFDSYRETILPFQDITAVRCRKFPLIKGFVEIVAGRRKLILPSTITGFSRLGGALRRGLERAGKADLLDETKLRTLGVYGSVSERWNGRARDTFGIFIVATVVSALFNQLVASLFWGVEVLLVIVWTGLGLLLPLVSYSAADLLLNRRMEKALMNGTDSGIDAAAIHLGVALAAGLAFGAFGILFKSFFLP